MIRQKKLKNSVEKVGQLRASLEDNSEIKKMRDLTIFVSGSYARKEASEHSDIDLFFVHDGDLEKEESPRIQSLRMFSEVIKISDSLGFPKFSNDGEFLKIIEKNRILTELGGREDDYNNHFTARMLLILESQCAYNQAAYNSIIKSVLSAYFKDYPDHPKDFQPTFLVNDIIRFWKTLCLNYENKRNQPDDDQRRKIKQKIKNLKLKFSRMLTCYGSICYIVDLNGNVDSGDLTDMISLTPLERLMKACEGREECGQHLERAITHYEWFLTVTDVSEEELQAKFDSKDFRTSAFEHASQFGDEVFAITNTIATSNNYLRFLLV